MYQCHRANAGAKLGRPIRQTQEPSPHPHKNLLPSSCHGPLPVTPDHPDGTSTGLDNLGHLPALFIPRTIPDWNSPPASTIFADTAISFNSLLPLRFHVPTCGTWELLYKSRSRYLKYLTKRIWSCLNNLKEENFIPRRYYIDHQLWTPRPHLFFRIYYNYQTILYLLDIMLIFDRCHRSWVTLIPDQYEHEWTDLEWYKMVWNHFLMKQ